MRFQIDIACDNAAFTNDEGDYDYEHPFTEIKAVLERATSKLDVSFMEVFDERLPLLDTNGNTVGFMRYYDDPPGPGNGDDGRECPNWNADLNGRCGTTAGGRLEPAERVAQVPGYNPPRGGQVWRCKECGYDITRVDA